MSVLLEALKKAAADKKRALENSKQSNQVEVSLIQKDTPEKNKIAEPSVESDVLDSNAQSALNKPAEIKLSLNESAFSEPLESVNKPEVIPAPPTPSSKEAPKAIFKLDLNLDNTLETDKTLNVLKEPDEEVSNSEPKASLKLALEETTEQNTSFLDKSLTEDTIKLSTEQSLVEPSNASGDSNIDSPENSSESTRDPLKGGAIAPNTSSEQLKENKKVDLHLTKEDLGEVSVTSKLTQGTVNLLKEETLDDAQGSSEREQVVLSTSTRLNAELDKDVPREGEVSEDEKESTDLLQHLVKKSNIQIDKRVLKEDEDSYKWSLDALPGYLGLGRKKHKKIKKDSTEGGNPILVAGALSEDPARPTKKISVKLILILLVLLLLIGIIFYGALYYQGQHEALEQRMKKYNLVKTHIAVEERSGTVENRVEQFAKNLTEDNVKQAPLNNIVVEPTSIESVQKELQTGIEASGSFEKNNQTQSKSQSQGHVKNSLISDMVTQKREASTLPLGKEISNRVANVPKISNDTPRKAVIVVHSEERILSEAYLNYGEGDFIGAQQAFETVLTMNPNNEFALIGLGNILASNQQYASAMAFYQKALIAQPSSLNAFEAIANISGHIELSSDWKIALSEMAQDHSESATLQYALGNVYAEESDWLSAQSAYFQAVALEPDNADYLVNLAVSLDQLGKYQLAARYYTEALAFVDVEAVNFNESQVKNRLISIRQFLVGRTQ